MSAKIVFLFTTILSLGLTSSQLLSCDGCLGLQESQCEATNGCFFSATRRRCENACEYPDFSSCNSCNRTCNWVGGIIDTCIVRWDVSFTMCFVVDDSESIDSGLPRTNTPEWDVIRNVFIKGVVEAVSPPSCNPANPATSRNCPRVGVVQFNLDSLVVVPEITKSEPQYAKFGNMSVCFGPNTTIPVLGPDFNSRIDSMLRGVDRDTGSGGSTFTLRGVSRCVDLLVNTLRVDPRAVQLLVLESDGPPNGPLAGCIGTCSACETDDVKTTAFGDINDPILSLFLEHTECEQKWWPNQTEWLSQFQRTNREIIQQYSIKTYNVYFKSDTNPPAPLLQCLTSINEPRNSQTLVTSADLIGFTGNDSTAIRRVIDGAVKIGNTICEFETLPPTSSPTFNPTSSPTKNPTSRPTSNPTSSPSKNPTKNPTKSPTTNPTGNPTQKPSANPTSNPTRNPSRNPSANPTQNPTSKPSANPTKNPTTKPTGNPTKNPSGNPSSNPTQNPTGSPTRAPTTCLSRDIPSFTRSTCRSPSICSGPNAVVQQIGVSTITVNSAQGTTTFCYQFSLASNPGGSCPSAGLPVTSISFITDECCPVPTMEFLSSVAVPNVVEYNRVSCTSGDVLQAFNSQCTRTSRTCEADPTKSCGVVNVNSLDLRSPIFGYCLTVSGTNFVAPGGVVNPASSGKAKICFERDTGNAQTQNVCSCVEVAFVKSDAICRVTPRPTKSPTRNPTQNPTSNPTANPSANPTLSPTTCQQREVPNFKRKDCLQANGCTGSAAAVTVSNNGNPVSVTTNTAAGTTTVCYTLNLPTNLASPCSDSSFQPLRGVSFVIDECCPAPTMEFLESVRLGGMVSVNREQCVEGNVAAAFDNLCTRTSRPCVANSNDMCSVFNLNGLNETAGGSVDYCITVQGTNFDVNPPTSELDPAVRGSAKMCFERGLVNPSGPLNVCTCVRVGFIDSQRLCNATASPSAGPTRNPTAKPTQNPTLKPTPNPSSQPTKNPTENPTSNPTQNPTANPTKNPTSSPTTCRQRPPPNFPRKDCDSGLSCDGSSSVVTVGNNNNPSVVMPNADGTTTVCYDLTLVASPDPSCGSGNQAAMTGVSFILGECCPTPMMQYFDVVSISGGGSGSTSVSVNREDCVEGDFSQTTNSPCTRTTRTCQSDSSQQCTVLNLNNLNVNPGVTVQYCIKVRGDNFALASPPNTLDPSVKGIAKFCFERGSTSPSGPTNVCTCTPVGFIESPRLCTVTPFPSQIPTANPTANPSKTPTKNPTANPTSNPTKSPTTCLSRDIPDFTGKDCTDTTTCTGSNAIVQVTGSTVTANQATGTTKLCYQIAFNNASGACAVGNVPVRGISFLTDECCPAPDMDFLDTVSVTSSGDGSTQFNRVECVKGGVASAFANSCMRTTRSCVSKPLANCSVLNVNNLSVNGPNLEYCVEIGGTNYDVVSPGSIDLDAVGEAKICFERGLSAPPGSNVCSCVEVPFIKSDRICTVTPSPTKAPTQNPTQNPTANPTVSPTTCKQSEVPNFPRKDCSDANGCSGSSAIVTVANGGEPTATSNGDGTTTLCYDLNLVPNPGGSCSSAGNQTMTGVSFIIDECCPTPMMEFFETVSLSGGGAGSSSVSVNREECTEGNATETTNSACTRTRRTCKSDSTQQCTVLNLNNLNVIPGAAAKYCIKVQGDFDVQAPAGQLDPDVKGKAKFCVERGSTTPGGPINVCTCVEVAFVESPRLCTATFAPTAAPTEAPEVKCLKAPVFPVPDSCDLRCDSKSNWNVSFLGREVSSDASGKVTTFSYSASTSGHPSKKTWKRNNQAGSGGYNRRLYAKVSAKKVSKVTKVSKRGSNSGCKGRLEAWFVRLNECCGVGVLEDAVANGNVTLKLNGRPCLKHRYCRIKSDGQNGDVIEVYQPFGRKTVLSIVVRGEVELACGGSACAQGKNGCACKPIETPKTCFLPARPPTMKPTPKPSRRPTSKPTRKPITPTRKPTRRPMSKATKRPTNKLPTWKPTKKPTNKPIRKPTKKPTRPTRRPIYTKRPTNKPITPTRRPTRKPTLPTWKATARPTRPTWRPTNKPTRKPTNKPVAKPTRPTWSLRPTYKPTMTKRPTTKPTQPTWKQTNRPTNKPTSKPTNKPTRPTWEPTNKPTSKPTNKPTSAKKKAKKGGY